MTLKYLLFSLLFSLSAIVTAAQTPAVKVAVGDTSLVIPSEFSNSLDYMLQSWATRHSAKSNCQSSELPPLVSDSICKLRLSKLPYLMEMPYNSTVRTYIDLYTIRKRRQMESMLGMSDYYFPLFEQVLGAYNLPLELKYLSIIESALNTTIVSRMGAAGLWQLMIATGKMYGLEINSLVDERLSPQKATLAAARFMKDLHSIYGDWNLVIAAYNCGPGNVNKAIRKSGGKRDYWAIYPYLPKETRGYVPIFIAANYSLHYAKEHNLCSANANMPAITDTIMVHKRVHLMQVSNVLHLPIELVRLLNPQYRKDIIPGNTKPYVLCLPLKYVNQYVEMEAEILGYKADSLVNNRRAEIEIIENPKAVAQEGTGGKLKMHRVLKGQSLKKIAAKYGISVPKLKSWNGIKGDKVKVGTLLQVTKYTAETTVEPSKEPVKAVTEEPKPNLDLPAVVPSPAVLAKGHLVAKGQSLFNIAALYGLTVDNLKEWNALKDAQVKVGDHLKLCNPNPEVAKKGKLAEVEKLKKAEIVTAPESAVELVVKPKHHFVRSGDLLPVVAKKYGVTVAALKKWNYLKKKQLKVGMRLIVSNPNPPKPLPLTIETTKKTVESKKPEVAAVETIKKAVAPNKAEVDSIETIKKTVAPAKPELAVLETPMKAVAPTTSEAAPKTHLVKKRQSLATISKKYKLSVAELKELNHLKGDKLQVGDCLIVSSGTQAQAVPVEIAKQVKTPIPPKKLVRDAVKEVESDSLFCHTVKAGESLASVADQYHVRVASLKRWNQLKSIHLSVGDKLVIKTSVKSSAVTTTPAVVSPVAAVAVEKPAAAVVVLPKDHIVVHGESLASIATKYGLHVADLKKWNRLNTNRLDIGDCLQLSSSTNASANQLENVEGNVSKPIRKKKLKSHTVSKGQNLGAIANRYGVSVDDLKRWNKLKDSRLSIGDKIKLGE